MALELDEFKNLILALRKEVTLTLELSKESGKPVKLDQNSVGRLSRIDAMQGQAIALANTKRQQTLLVALDSALVDIENGDYGRCQECDELIAIARLELNPTAQHCVSCAEKLEFNS
jgi:DnaK suppressor protein